MNFPTIPKTPSSSTGVQSGSKKESSMGSWEGAETCVGMFLLLQLKHLPAKIGLYRDNGLSMGILSMSILFSKSDTFASMLGRSPSEQGRIGRPLLCNQGLFFDFRQGEVGCSPVRTIATHICSRHFLFKVCYSLF